MEPKSGRQVSYFGPIYIRNSVVELPDVHTECAGADATSSPDPLDVSKYRIKTPTSVKKHAPPPPTQHIRGNNKTRNENVVTGEKGNNCNMNGTDSHKPAQNGRSSTTNCPQNYVPDTANTSPCARLKDKKQRYMKGRKSDPNADVETLEINTNGNACSSKSASVTQTEGDTHGSGDYEEYSVIDKCPFKISSTEDNYMFDKYKNKALAAQKDKIELDNTGKPNRKNGFHQRSKSSPEEESTSLKERKESHSGRDFLSKHRKRIAKLKRRFFESQPIVKPLSPKTITGTNPVIDVPPESNESAKTDGRLNQQGLENGEETISSSPKSGSNSDTVSERRRHHSADGLLGKYEFEASMNSRWSTSGDEFMVVIAIDFGTTYSGYAYSFVHEPETINLMRRHESGEPGIFDQKIPTTILLTPEGVFHSFGYAARDFYHDLEPREASKWLYFERFKMLLHREGTLKHDSVLRTYSGREVSAMKVFSYSLAFFKDLAIQEITDQSTLRISTDVIRWVITVPAIWKASAKQFMRQAAYEAGIVSKDRPDQLLIALEPEAASIYCRRLRLFQVLSAADDSGESVDSRDVMSRDVSRTSSWSLPELRNTEISVVSNDLQIGTRYMVVDCGGGTVDITVHEIGVDKRLKELQRASGGAHGSVGVDEEFVKLLGSIFGHDILDQFRRRRASGWVELMAMFESRKRTASPYRASSISVPLPFSFIDFFKKCRGGTVETAVRKHGDVEITWTSNGMLRLSPGAMRRLFRPTVDRIKQAIGDVLNNPRLIEIEYMFLAGGFAESSIIQHELRKDFGAILNIIIPPGAAITVLKGAVCFGLDPAIINSRCSCLTYGIGVLHRYDATKHPENKKVTKDGCNWCTDVFDTFVCTNQSVELGERIIRRYTPVRRDQTATTINIYSTDTDDVTFITDPGVTKCGTLTLTLSDAIPIGQRREIRTEMMFGDTEIRVKAVDVSDGHGVEASVDFINF